MGFIKMSFLEFRVGTLGTKEHAEGKGQGEMFLQYILYKGDTDKYEAF